MSEIETTIKVVRFSKAKDWMSWKELFLARVGRKDPEMKKCFNMKEEFPLEGEDGKMSAEVEKNWKTMTKAYEALLMSMNYGTPEGLVAFNIVKRAKTGDEGDARLAFQRLINRFEPKTSIAKGQLLKQFYSSKCKQKEDPEVFIYEMDELRNRILDISPDSEGISDEDFMNQVLNSMPSYYDALVERLQERIDSEGEEKLTIEKMAKQLGFKFAKMKTG